MNWAREYAWLYDLKERETRVYVSLVRLLAEYADLRHDPELGWVSDDRACFLDVLDLSDAQCAVLDEVLGDAFGTDKGEK